MKKLLLIMVLSAAGSALTLAEPESSTILPQFEVKKGKTKIDIAPPKKKAVEKDNNTSKISEFIDLFSEVYDSSISEAEGQEKIKREESAFRVPFCFGYEYGEYSGEYYVNPFFRRNYNELKEEDDVFSLLLLSGWNRNLESNMLLIAPLLTIWMENRERQIFGLLPLLSIWTKDIQKEHQFFASLPLLTTWNHNNKTGAFGLASMPLLCSYAVDKDGRSYQDFASIGIPEISLRTGKASKWGLETAPISSLAKFTWDFEYCSLFFDLFRKNGDSYSVIWPFFGGYKNTDDSFYLNIGPLSMYKQSEKKQSDEITVFWRQLYHYKHDFEKKTRTHDFGPAGILYNQYSGKDYDDISVLWNLVYEYYEKKEAELLVKEHPKDKSKKITIQIKDGDPVVQHRFGPWGLLSIYENNLETGQQSCSLTPLLKLKKTGEQYTFNAFFIDWFSVGDSQVQKELKAIRKRIKAKRKKNKGTN